jgi:hypothetical protein
MDMATPARLPESTNIVTQPEDLIASHVIHWQTFLIELCLIAGQFMPLAAEHWHLSTGS